MFYRFKSLTMLVPTAFLINLTPLHAQEVIGTIVGTLGDEQRTWYATLDGGESQSFFLDQGSIKSASIWGNPADDVLATERDALMLDFTYFQVGGTTQLAGSEIAWFSVSQKEAYRSEEGGVTLTLETVEEAAGGVRVTGRFEATLAFTSDYGETFDAGNTRAVTGSFDAVLPES